MSNAAAKGHRHLRVLVCPHELTTGGSQINAIDLASRIRDRGHEVHIFAPHGTLVDLVVERGLPYTTAPRFEGDSLRPAVLAAFARQIKQFGPDIVHTYESPPSIVSAVVSRFLGHRNVTTVMSMSVPDFLPQHVPLFVGTEGLAAGLTDRAGKVYVMEPPVDTAHDAPHDIAAARRHLGVDEDAFVISVVGRLSREHQKARGVALAINALSQYMRAGHRLTLLVAGSGDDEDIVREAAVRAARSNPHLRVRLEGNISDPRDIYDAADVVFGMGGSALRALAHAKPLIVQGADGYWKLFEPATADEFRQNGFFGYGPTETPGFCEIIQSLYESQSRRVELGSFGRTLVKDRYSLERAVEVLEEVYLEHLKSDVRAPFWSLRRTVFDYAKFRVAARAPGLRAARQGIRVRVG